jgi:hypothetical protein
MIPRLDVAVERRVSGARFGGPPCQTTCLFEFDEVCEPRHESRLPRRAV